MKLIILVLSTIIPFSGIAHAQLDVKITRSEMTLPNHVNFVGVFQSEFDSNLSNTEVEACGHLFVFKFTWKEVKENPEAYRAKIYTKLNEVCGEGWEKYSYED